MCVPHRMRQYPNANSEDVREEWDNEEGCNPEEKMGGVSLAACPWNYERL